MGNENGRLGTPVFYKFIVGVFTMLFVGGVAGIWNTNSRLVRIETKLENIEKNMLDRFTGKEGKDLIKKVDKNSNNTQILAEKLNDHLIWAAQQEQWMSK